MAPTTPLFPDNHNRILQNFCTNVHNLVTVKLDNHNFQLWHKQIKLTIKAYMLMHLLDGNSTAPTPFVLSGSPATPQPNPDYDTWNETDALLLSNLLSTLSPSLLLKYSHHNTAASLWSDLLDTFTSISTSHIDELKRQLDGIRKTSTMEDYLSRIKEISEKLATAGAPMTEIDIVYKALSFLPPEYDPTATQTLLFPSLGCRQCFATKKFTLPTAQPHLHRPCPPPSRPELLPKTNRPNPSLIHHTILTAPPIETQIETFTEDGRSKEEHNVLNRNGTPIAQILALLLNLTKRPAKSVADKITQLLNVVSVSIRIL